MSPRSWFGLAVGLALTALGCGATSTGEAPEPMGWASQGLFTYDSGRIIVKFRDGVSNDAKNALHEKLGASIVRVLRGGEDLVRVAPDVAAKRLRAYREAPGVLSAQLDVLLPPMHNQARTPADPYLSYLWASSDLELPAAWSMTTGRADQLLAICDSGVDLAHPDLVSVVRNDLCYNTASDTPGDCGPVITHGTHVAGIAAAVGDNGEGAAGVTWQSRIIPVRISNQSNGYAFSADMADCVRYAADHGAAVVNMSYSTYDQGAIIPVILDAANDAFSRGTLVVVSTGNEGIDPMPGQDPDSILYVGAVSRTLAHAGYSNYGALVDLVAPGDDIIGPGTTVACTDTDGDGTVDPGSCQVTQHVYVTAGGTSLAAPYVAGAAMLLKALQPLATPAELRAALLAGARDLGPAGEDGEFGAGLLNVHQALHSIASNFVPNAPPVITRRQPTTATVTVGQGNALTLVASASDAEDGDLTSSLTWTCSDGLVFRGGTVNRTFATSGQKWCELRVRDSGGLETVLRVPVKVTALPAIAAPKSLTAKAQVGRKVALAWKDASASETAFVVSRAKVSTSGAVGAWSTRVTTARNVVAYVDAAAAGRFAYKVCAKGGASGLLCSSVVKVTVR